MTATLTNPAAEVDLTETFRRHPVYTHLWVSTNGRVWSEKSKGFLRGFLGGGGSSGPSTGRRRRPNTYRKIDVGPGFAIRYPRVSALVLETFVGPRPAGHDADHENRVRAEDRLSNLRWLPAEVNRGRNSHKIK